MAFKLNVVMRILNTLKLSLLSLAFISLSGCHNSESNTKNAALPEPTISVKLVDESGDFEALHLEVAKVMVNMEGDENNWIPLNPDQKDLSTVNLSNGKQDVLINKSLIPSGILNRLKLVLGDNSTIVIKNGFDDDEAYDLKTSKAQKDGLELGLGQRIRPGFAYEFVVDFKIDESIVFSGQPGDISLTSLMSVATEMSSGIIEGSISPSDEPTMISIIDTKETPETDDDEVISAYTNYLGHFALSGVPTGTYQVLLKPVDANSKYKAMIIPDIEVIDGEVTFIRPVL